MLTAKKKKGCKATSTSLRLRSSISSTYSSRSRVQKPKQKHTTGGIPRWSPTLVLVARFSAYVWQSGRDAQFSLTYGRMYRSNIMYNSYSNHNHRPRSFPSGEKAIDRSRLAISYVASLNQPVPYFATYPTFQIFLSQIRHKHPHTRKMLGRSKDSSE